MGATRLAPVRLRDDPRVASIPWRDLVRLGPWEAVKEIGLSLPWFAGAWLSFARFEDTLHAGWLAAALACCFWAFLTGLRQVHGATHGAVGLSHRGDDLLLFALSIVMTGSMHVIRHVHLLHHRHGMGEGDVEGSVARLSWRQALLLGPRFPLRLHAAALRDARGISRRWMGAELAGNVAVVVLAASLALVAGTWWPCAFIATMWAAQSMSGFFAVWTVHHGCDADREIARTQRGWLKNAVSYQMFHHLEHHLFPSVPACNWPTLARRLDAVAPELRKRGVY